MQVAVIGAGMAGLAVAGDLQQQGHSVVVFEKSRGLGGRAATRRVGAAIIDHGAQYLKEAGERLTALIAASRDAGGQPIADIAAPVWVFDQHGTIAEGDPAQNRGPKWIWPAGINTLGKLLADGLEVRLNTTVAALAGGPGAWRLLDQTGVVLATAEIVILTAPAPQSAAIIATSELVREAQDQLVTALEVAQYRQQFSLTYAYPGPIERPWYALINHDREHAIAWLAREDAKPGRVIAAGALLTAQMSHAWSVEHWKALDRGSYGEEGAALPRPLRVIHGELSALLKAELPVPTWVNVQRWRYALPDQAADKATLWQVGAPLGLYFGGDFMVGVGRVHLAIENGWQLAAEIAAYL